MAFRSSPSMEYTDDEKYDRQDRMNASPDVPDYPGNLQFSISADDLAKAGGEDGDIDDTMRFAAMAEVTSVSRNRDDTRVELQINQFADEDGKFFDLKQPAYVCLCGPELEKMDLESDCERGDMIHLIGTARMEGSSDTEWSGNMVRLQITELSYEDESEESRGG